MQGNAYRNFCEKAHEGDSKKGISLLHWWQRALGHSPAFTFSQALLPIDK
jgi:hypothetical protein